MARTYFILAIYANLRGFLLKLEWVEPFDYVKK